MRKWKGLVLSDPEFTEGESKGFTLSMTKGFTLIEVLIVLSVMAVLFGLGYAQYRSFERRQVLNNAFEKFKTDLNLARQRALSGEKPAACPNALVGYQVTLNSSSYVVQPQCGGGTSPATTSFPQGIQMSPQTSLLYKVLGEGTDLNSTLTVTLTNGTNNKSLTITPQGKIE